MSGRSHTLATSKDSQRVFGMCEETEEREGKPCNLHNTTCKLNSRKGPSLGIEPTTSCMCRNQRKQLTTLIDCAEGRFLFLCCCCCACSIKRKARYPSPPGIGQRSKVRPKSETTIDPHSIRPAVKPVRGERYGARAA